MGKLFLSIIAALCCFAASAAGTQPSTGNGSQADPYQIESLENLLWFAEHVNQGNVSACAILMDDITMNEGVLNSYGTLNGEDFVEWTPIGGHGVDYSGKFNGNGHTISGLYFKNTNTNNVGLFGKANNNAHIHDLGVIDSYFYGHDHVGGICGDFANGRIENCWNGATVYAKDWNAGGISGSCWKYASIKDCYNIGRIKPCDNGNPSYGGICGAVYENTGVDYTISNCFTLYGKCDKGVYGSLDEGCPASKINHSFVKDDDAFASGEVCYKLAHGVTGGSQKWFQTLGTDDFPVLSNSHGTVYYGYDGDVLKYSNSPIFVGATHRDVCAATCNSVGYTMECWEDTRSGRFYAEETCATELNAAYVTTYSPVMTTPEYSSSIAGWPWSMQNESVTYDGVTFINALEKVYPDEASYISSEYVWFKVKDASAKNVRLKWHLDKNTFNGELYYKINDGDETKIDISPEMWVQNLPDLQQDDKVTVYYRIASMWSFPLTWTMSLEYCPGHNLEHVAYKEPTCTEKGNYENWYCKKCDKHFADAECTTVMTDWEIPALGHTPEYRAQRAATCTEDGYTRNHWHCTVCGRNYADEACTIQITEDVVLPKINHQHKQHHDALDATCLTDGNIEYWYCPDCNTHFTDEACTTSTTEYAIAALGHDFTHTPYTTSTCTSEGVVEHWHCGRCGHDFNVGDPTASEDHVIDGNLTVPLKVSDVILVGMDDGLTYDDCHTFTPPTEEGETLIATVTFDEETVMMKIKNGEETPYSLNDERPLETFFAHTFKLTADQDPANTSDYYVTFYTSEGAYKVPKTAKAYAGAMNDEQLMMTNTGDIIHKSEAMMLKDNQSDITLMPSCNKDVATESNDLVGTDVAKTLGEGDFALSIGENGIAFYNWDGKGIGDNTAYLKGNPDAESIAVVVYDGVLVKITNQDDSTVTLYGLKKVEFLKENNVPAVRVTYKDDSTKTYTNPKKVEFGR